MYNEENGLYDVLAQGNAAVSDSGGNTLSVPLLPRTITGRVISGGLPVAGAAVTVVSRLNSATPYESMAVTNAEGWFETLAYAGNSNVLVSKPGFIDGERSFNMTSAGSIGDITLEKAEGLNVALNMTYTAAVVQGNTPLTINFTNTRNLLFTLRNISKGQVVTEYAFSGLSIVIEDETVVTGDEILVRAEDISGNMTAAEGRFNAGGGVVNLAFIQKGYWKAQITPQKATMALLYDNAGRYINTFDGDTGFTGDVLSEDSYSLVFVHRNNLLRQLGNISDFGMLGLVEGTDYVRRTFSVTPGVITDLGTVQVPELGGTKLNYTDSARTSMTLSRSEAVAGIPVSVRVKYGFAEKYMNAISDITLVAAIPEGCELFLGSVSLDGKPAQYVYTASGIEVQASGAGGILHFYIVPIMQGNHTVNAFIRFSHDGNIVTQPVGTAVLKAKSLEINVPGKTSFKRITVNGIAAPDSTVVVFDNDTAVGTARANAVGSWQIQFELVDPGVFSSHDIYAGVTTLEGIMLRSENRELLYDETIPTPKMTISNGANEPMVLDFVNPDPIPPSYIYSPLYPAFTFVMEFNRPYDISGDVFVITRGSDGQKIKVKTAFDSARKIWVGRYDYTEFNTPEWVSVEYYDHDSGTSSTSILQLMKLAPIIDPSGYVYEAVESNRLSGVTATAYFSEYEDGRNRVVWDALEYDQRNPLVTDAAGRYAWDVPFGWWQVKFEKDGYENAWSEWVPVPPVQTEVNVGMVSMAAPSVSSMAGYENYIEIMFDRYMDTASLTNGSITIPGGYDGGYSIGFVGAEPDPYPAPENADKLFARIARIVPQGGKFEMGGLVGVCVGGEAKSYAGVILGNTCQNVGITYEPLGLSVEAEIGLNYGESRTIEVAVFPAEAGVNKKITAVSSSPFLVTVNAEAMTNGSGVATFTVNGEISGAADIVFTLENTLITNTAAVNIGLPGGTVEPSVVLESIAITAAPAKTAYFVGDAVDVSGMVVTAHYSDGSSERATGYDYSPKVLGTAGQQTITVSYEGRTDAFTVTVNEIPAAEPDLRIISYTLVGTARSGNFMDYEFRVTVTNQGGDAKNVSASLTGWPGNTTVKDGSLYFGDVSAGTTVTSEEDTFKIRLDRTGVFDESLLVFTFDF